VNECKPLPSTQDTFTNVICMASRVPLLPAAARVAAAREAEGGARAVTGERRRRRARGDVGARKVAALETAIVGCCAYVGYCQTVTWTYATCPPGRESRKRTTRTRIFHPIGCGLALGIGHASHSEPECGLRAESEADYGLALGIGRV
jgi:hypothetical protein